MEMEVTVVGTRNTGRAWVLAKVADTSTMKDAVTAIAELNREKKPEQPGPAADWYIVRADEVDIARHLMIVVDAETPGLLRVAIGRLKGLDELDQDSFTEYRVTDHHPEGPHQGVWDEIEKPDNPGSSSDGGSNLSDPKKPASPRPNPANPWG
jgi:hypothetical protein